MKDKALEYQLLSPVYLGSSFRKLLHVKYTPFNQYKELFIGTYPTLLTPCIIPER